MLDKLHESFKILSVEESSREEEYIKLNNIFDHIPQDYIDLIKYATEIELKHDSGKYIRIWSPEGCIDQEEGYEISKFMPGSFPFGDNGGGKILFYDNGNNGYGIYSVGYGNLDIDEAVFISNSLKEILINSDGIEFLEI